MPIQIRPAAGIATGHVIREWTRLIENGLRAHYGDRIAVVCSDAAHESVVALTEGDRTRGEISISVAPSVPDQLNIRPRAARGKVRDGYAAMITGAALSVLCWIVFVVWFWETFREIDDMRGKVFWLCIITIGAILSTFGFAFAGDHIAARLCERIDAPRREHSRRFVDDEVWPWLQSYLDQVWEHARQDPVLARRLGLDFSA